MLIHVRDEMAYPHTANDKSSLKVYRVEEFVDTRFATSFFPDERKRWNALRQRQRQQQHRHPSDKTNDVQQLPDRRDIGGVVVAEGSFPPSAKL